MAETRVRELTTTPKEVKMQLFDQAYIGDFLLRYLHILVGITWIGLLYYFNLVQVPGLAAYGDEGKARMITIDKIARRALWWFRWAAIATLGTGLLITGIVENYWSRSGDAHKYTNKLLWPYESHKNAMITGGVLWLILWIASEVLLK
ncbi:MAG: hypothetical protein EB050_04735 [Actinobacteria bacterium]|nr:hypothetical protein [Actinomycetota bacterium]